MHENIDPTMIGVKILIICSFEIIVKGVGDSIVNTWSTYFHVHELIHFQQLII